MTFQFNDNAKQQINNDIGFINNLLYLTKEETFDFIESCKRLSEINQLKDEHIKAVLRYIEIDLKGDLHSNTYDKNGITIHWLYFIPNINYGSRLDISIEYFNNKYQISDLLWKLRLKAKILIKNNYEFHQIVDAILDHAYDIRQENNQ